MADHLRRRNFRADLPLEDASSQPTFDRSLSLIPPKLFLTQCLQLLYQVLEFCYARSIREAT